MSLAQPPKGLSEAAFQQRVLDLCRWHRHLVFHDHDSRRNPSGFPDLVIVGHSGALFRELKTDTGRMRPDQVLWLERLRLVGEDADVWRPTDWDRIQAELKDIR